MQQAIVALLVHAEEPCFQVLKSILQEQGIETRLARSCAEASASFLQQGLPQLVFTDAGLCDGTWADVLSLVSAPDSAELIVVSRVLDHHLYLDVIESGAFDFMVPPFEPEDVAFIVRSAIWNYRYKRSQPPRNGHRPPQQAPAGTGGPQSHDA